MNPHLFLSTHCAAWWAASTVYVCNFQCAILVGTTSKGWWWSKNGCLLDNDEFMLSFSLANTRPRLGHHRILEVSHKKNIHQTFAKQSTELTLRSDPLLLHPMGCIINFSELKGCELDGKTLCTSSSRPKLDLVATVKQAAQAAGLNAKKTSQGSNSSNQWFFFCFP